MRPLCVLLCSKTERWAFIHLDLGFFLFVSFSSDDIGVIHMWYDAVNLMLFGIDAN